MKLKEYASSRLLVALSFGLLVANAFPLRGTLDRDAAAYAYIGNRIAAGAVPYRDVWDHKPPLFYYWNALLSMLGVGGREGLFWVDLAIAAATALALWRVARIVMSPERASIAVLLYAAVGRFPFWTQSPNMTEALLAFLQVLAYWAVARGLKNDKKWPWLGAGVILAVAVLVKQPAALDAVVVATLIIARTNNRIRNVITFASSAAIVFIVVVAVLASQGAAADAYDQVVAYNSLYVHWGMTKAAENWLMMLALLGFMNVPVMMVTFVKRYQQQNTERSDLDLLVWLWFGATLIEGFAGANPYRHYFIPFFLPLSLLAAQRLPAFSATKGKVTLGAVQLPIIVGWQIVLLSAFASLWSPASPSTVDMMQWVKSCGSNQEPIYVWGAEAQVYLETDRYAPTRYFYNYPLLDRFGDVQGSGYATAERWQELRDALSGRPPSTVLVAPQHNVPAESVLAHFLENYRDGPAFGKWRTFVRADVACGQRTQK